MHGEGTGGAITQAGRATHSWARVCQLPLRTCHPPQRLTARGSSCEKEVAASLGHEDRTSGRARETGGLGLRDRKTTAPRPNQGPAGHQNDQLAPP